MNSLSNIWTHPKTSAAGLLIGITTIAGVFSQHGITLGTAGSGTVVSLAGGLAAALLGLLARDPESSTAPASSTNATAKLGVWALIALLLPFTGGCSGTTVAQDIVNWTPALQSAVATVDSSAALLNPADAPIFLAATVGFNAASNALVLQAKAYLANPSATVLARLQSQVVIFQQQVNAALLSAARITNPTSQQHALNEINVVGTAVNAIFALVTSISSKAAIARMASQSKIKLSEVAVYEDRGQIAAIVADHYNEPIATARAQVAFSERNAIQAGF